MTLPSVAAIQEQSATQELANQALASKTSATEMSIYHDLGATVTDNMTVTDQLKLIDLNWSPESTPIRYGSFFEHQTSASHALFKPDSGQFMGCVSQDWYSELHSFESILGTFNAFCQESGIKLERVGKLQSTTNQEQLKLTLFAVASLGDGDQFELSGNDLVTGKILLTAPYIYGQGYKVGVMSIRKVCSNGLVLPVKIAQKSLAHTYLSSETMIEVLEAAKSGWGQFITQSQTLAKTAMAKEQALVLLVNQFGNAGQSLESQPKVVQTCLSLFEESTAKGGDLLSAYNTAWGLLNCVTEYYNHHAVSKNANTQLSSLWLGGKAKQQVSFLESISGFAHAAVQSQNNRQSVSQAVTAW